MKFPRPAVLLPLVLSAHATILFEDSFDRPDNRNISASLAGITDTTGEHLAAGAVYKQPFLDPKNGPPDYGVQDESPANGGGARIRSNQLQLAVGKGTSNVLVNHNFTDSAITGAGGFAVSVDVSSYSQAGPGQGGGFAVGMSRENAIGTGDAANGVKRMTGGFGTAIGNAIPEGVASDFWVALRGNGTLVWGGHSGTVEGARGLVSKSGKLTVRFTTGGFAAGGKVAYRVLFNGVEQGGGDFAWSKADTNYIGIDSRDAEFVAFDNFSVATAVPEAVVPHPEAVIPKHPPKAGRPNVLVMLVDDLGWSDLGCYGGEIPTPNLDALAADGVRFRQFYNSARCSPTRCSLVTGLYPQQAAVKPAAPLPNLRSDNNVTFAELLGAEGYRTYMAGKWHLGNGELLPENRGFQHVWRFANGAAHSTDNWTQSDYRQISLHNEIPFRDYTGTGRTFYQTDAIGDYAVDYINHTTGKHDGAPFLMYLAFGAPHFPIQAPGTLADTFVPTYAKGWDVLRRERYDRQLAKGVIDKRYPVPGPSGAGGAGSVEIPAWTSLDADRRADLTRRMALYAAMVKKMDDNVGKVIKRLRETGQLDNTLIFFMSDNGANYEGGVFGGKANHVYTGRDLAQMGQPGQRDIVQYGGGWAHLSNTPLKLFKHFTHEGGIRAPLIVHWPAGIKTPDSWVETPAHVIDVMASIVEVTGASYPSSFSGHPVLPAEGTSLLPLIRHEAPPARSLFAEHESNRTVRKGKWKLVTENFTPFNTEFTGNQPLLFDMDADPGESTNLAAREPAMVAALVAEWNAWALRVGLPPGRLIQTP